MDIPVICTLSAAELHKRKTTILASLRSAIAGRARIHGGYRYVFRSSTTIFHEASRIVEMESHCCQFLNFAIRQNRNSLELDVTGSAEALAMIEDLFG
jgi:hypothetical protein